MKYRFLGDSGLLVSQVGFGCFPLTDTPALASVDKAYELLGKAFDDGVNLWDTAEIYDRGANEVLIGQVFRRGVEEQRWTRKDLVIATKLFPGTTNGPNAAGLSRKHLVEGIKASLRRLDLDYVDVLLCHRPEPFTPIEETVRAMNFIINQGWAFYWGTSEWLATEILEACEIADRLGLIRPICEQVQYNLLERSKVESDFIPLYNKYKLGLMTWSPLKYGLLTGKYASGIPEGSRLSSDHHAAVVAPIFEKRVQQVEQLRPIAEELGCSIAQLALAWVTANANVSTMLLGATSLHQLEENVGAFAIVPKLTEEVMAQIDEAIPRELKLAKHDGFVTLRKQYL